MKPLVYYPGLERCEQCGAKNNSATPAIEVLAQPMRFGTVTPAHIYEHHIFFNRVCCCCQERNERRNAIFVLSLAVERRETHRPEVTR